MNDEPKGSGGTRRSALDEAQLTELETEIMQVLKKIGVTKPLSRATYATTSSCSTPIWT